MAAIAHFSQEQLWSARDAAAFCRGSGRNRGRSLRVSCHLTDSSAAAPSSSPNESSRCFPQSRRGFLSAAALSMAIVRLPGAAAAAEAPPMGFKIYTDQFDGYSFAYPGSWFEVRGAGADVFFRSPVNLDESVLVDISSPSSSRFKSLDDLGTPKDAAQGVLKQYLTEFMSTRLGVRRESSIVSSSSRTADDGRLFYEVEVNVKSFANNNQLAVAPKDRIAQLEWDRRYLSVLGVENNRLYQLRLQAPERTLQEEGRNLRQIMNSFQISKLST